MQWGIPQNIARGFHHGAEIPANHYISTRWVSGQYLWGRSVSIPWRSITHSSTDHTKVLQISTLRAVRVDAGDTLRGLVLVNHGPICPRLFDTSRLLSRPL